MLRPRDDSRLGRVIDVALLPRVDRGYGLDEIHHLTGSKRQPGIPQFPPQREQIAKKRIGGDSY